MTHDESHIAMLRETLQRIHKYMMSRAAPLGDYGQEFLMLKEIELALAATSVPPSEAATGEV
jgi:hypothetical protein